MGQPQFRVSFSVGTKLLLSLVGLLCIVIVFLNASTIFMLREDKRAYVYQAQSVEAILAGHEFITTAKHGLDTLRLFLGSVDPLKPITPQQTENLKSGLSNQTEVLTAGIALLNPTTGALSFLTQASRPESEIQKLELKSSELPFPPELPRESTQEITTKSFLFSNLSRIGGHPLLLVVIADLKFKDNPGGVPVAVGVLSLKGLGKEIRTSGITIATRNGLVLFDSDPSQSFAGHSMGGDPLFSAIRTSQLDSGAQEYDKDGERYLGSYYRPGLDTVVISKTEWRKAMRATYALTEKFVLLGLAAIGAAIVFAIIFSKTLTAPLNRLYEATTKVAHGDFNLDLEVRGGDEISALTGSFNVMSKQISELIEAKMQKARIENELAIASTVQQTLIPPPVFQAERLAIRSHYQSASECGGDWWGFFGVNNQVCIMIGDATGHGLPSALITAAARSCFSVMHKMAQELPEFSFSPGSMLSYANRVIHDSGAGKIMMTFFAGVIDFDRMVMTYSNAAHNPPWLFRKSENFKMASLLANGQRLGEVRDTPVFEEAEVAIAPGDILLLYTDGLVEGKSVGGEMYGKKRARKTVEAALGQGPEEVIARLVRDFNAHNGDKLLDDDLTLACAQFFPNASGGA